MSSEAPNERRARTRKEIKQLEDTMQEISEKQSELNQLLSDSDIYTEENKLKLQQLLLEKAELDKAHESAESAWLDANEAIEKIS